MRWLLVILPLTGGTTGFLLWRQDKRRGPIEWRTAALAESTAVSQADVLATGRTPLATAGAASAYYVQTSGTSLIGGFIKIERQDAKIEAQSLEIDAMRRENEAKDWSLRLWGHWYKGLDEDWDEHRTKAAPPPPPENG